MPRSANHSLTIALGTSALSLIIAVVAIVYAVTHTASTASSGSAVLPSVESRPLTVDNPAAALPHAARVESAGGLVISVSTDRVVLAPTTTPKTIMITPDTKIFQQGPEKTPEKYQKEFDAFRETLRYASGSSQIFIAPKRFATTPLKLSDISIGDLVLMDTDGGDPARAINVYRMQK